MSADSVDELGLKPNCFGPYVASKAVFMLLSIRRSKIFAGIGIRLIGRMSSIFGVDTLGTGITEARFHTIGTLRSWIERLNR